LHLELLNGLRRRGRDRDGGVCAHPVHIHAVDLEIVLGHTRAVDRKSLSVAAYRSAVGQEACRAGRKSENLGEVACRQRQVRQEPGFHHAAQLRAVPLNSRNRGVDCYRFPGCCPDRQGRVDDGGLGDRHRDVVEELRLESRGRHANAIVSRRQQG
jgi:hypothetical protein